MKFSDLYKQLEKNNLLDIKLPYGFVICIFRHYADDIILSFQDEYFTVSTSITNFDNMDEKYHRFKYKTLSRALKKYNILVDEYKAELL